MALVVERLRAKGMEIIGTALALRKPSGLEGSFWAANADDFICPLSGQKRK